MNPAAFLLAAAFSFQAEAASLGRTSASFLNIGVDPKNVALGELGVALKNGAAGLYFNPANLGEKNLRELSLSYNDYFDDLNHQSLALGFGNSWGGLGFGLNRLGMAPIASFDANGASRGEIGVGSLALIAGFGRHITHNLSLGVASKLIYEDLGTIDGKTAAFDLGAIYALECLSFGAAASNLGPALVFEKEKFPLPQSLRLGVAYQIKNFRNLILASAEIESAMNQNPKGSFGLEYGFRDLLFLRAGFKSGQDIGSGLRAGFGILIFGTELNYAWANFGDLGLTHRLGITFKFGRPLDPENLDDPLTLPSPSRGGGRGEGELKNTASLGGKDRPTKKFGFEQITQTPINGFSQTETAKSYARRSKGSDEMPQTILAGKKGATKPAALLFKYLLAWLDPRQLLSILAGFAAGVVIFLLR